MRNLLFAGVCCLLAVVAKAQFYIGGAATTTDTEFETAVETFDSDEMGWKVYLGFTFLEFLGAEIGYRDLGNVREGTTDANIDLDLRVIDGSVRAILPVSIFNLFAKVGYANIDWDGEINIEDEIEDFNEDDWELFYGVGVELNLNESFAIRAEWEEYDASEDLNTLSAGILFRF